MSDNKRERYAKWLTEEKKLLKKLVKPYQSIVDSKDFTVNSNRDKHRAWSEITLRFNTANMRVRDEKQLLSQWRCMKKRKRLGLSSPLSSIDSTDNDISRSSLLHFSKSNGFDSDDIKAESPEMVFIDEMAEDEVLNAEIRKASKNQFNYSEANFKDLHRFRTLENNRQHKEHIIRIQNLEERHKQLMKNLKLQEEILKKQLESYD